jgi:hypothetical protein
MRINKRPAIAMFLAGLLCAASAHADVQITIVNSNGPGVGFNDPTPATPVGGNTGTTLGQQRLIAFQHVADLWGKTLTSVVPIRVQASFDPLPCDATGAVLGAAGTMQIFANFPYAPRVWTWYPGALAGKIAGADEVAPTDNHIIAFFNSRLGLAADCLPGLPFYLGLDNKHGDLIDFPTVLLHELGHGLGFQTFTDGETGQMPYLGLPSVWDANLIDNRTGKSWTDMAAAERVTSALSVKGLSWSGVQTTQNAPSVLSQVAQLNISGAAAGAAAGNYIVGEANFGPPLSNPAITGQLMPVVDQPDGKGLACTPLNAANSTAVRGNIALVDRGTCPFVTKAKHLQNAGARAMLVARDIPGAATEMGGADPSLQIPSLMVSFDDGERLKARLAKRSRTMSGVVASFGVDPVLLAGTDSAGRMLMHAPSPYAPGSSVSHYSTFARRNQLMEPNLNGDLLHTVTTPYDLTLTLLLDIGW